MPGTPTSATSPPPALVPAPAEAPVSASVPASASVPPSVSVEERWAQFYRWGPYATLALSTAISVFVDRDRAPVPSAALLLSALVLQLWWHRTRDRVPAQSRPAQFYYVSRTVLAFALTWLHPFYSIYAILGYFDVDRLMPRRYTRAGMLVTAVTMAGSQSGGLPPDSLLQAFVLAALFLLHCSLVLIFGHLAEREAENVREKAATIAELERTNARLEQALAENAALQAQLLVQAREAGVADERRRLAAEIHDTIAQGLAGIIAQLQVVTLTPDRALARVHLKRAADLARHSLGEARRSVQNLGPAELEHDTLPKALRKTVSGWAERSGLRAGFTVTGTEEPLHDEVAATLLRIAQEALANTDRHAAARRVGVTLSYMGDEITLDIRDDGRGFDALSPPPRSGTGGFGLAGMRARAERLAGTVTVESAPGEGTAVSARVPLVRHD
ncbi:sensor histidine kinase [Streptomyces sp. NPDC056987]|uniref:sensor histidine kinase n=1 Tax=Streptomyces sp. NPDC056987 TaxID=3345988 RepID=UPI00363D54FD